jgi:uncharacterized protein YecE (DUF72 family)
VTVSYEERRARREARRAKQRAESVRRAEAMHAARLLFDESHTGNGRAAIAESRRHWVGCSGWYYWHWRGRFYPDEPSNCWFAHYADRFRTVELNAPFYSWPTLKTVDTWLNQIGRRRFVYTIKANSLITHERRFVGTKRLVKDFYHIATLLGPHMGCFLFQLPPSVHYSRAMLTRILKQLDPRWRNVVEFRHRSWWREDVYEAFRRAGVIFCSCSGPRLPDELVKTTDELYLRFHGTTHWYRHDYSSDELRVWSDRVRASAAGRVWAYFNNDRECYAIKNARELMRQLRTFT